MRRAATKSAKLIGASVVADAADRPAPAFAAGHGGLPARLEPGRNLVYARWMLHGGGSADNDAEGGRVLFNETLPRIVACPLTQFVENMEATVGQGDWSAAAQYFTEDVLYRVGYRPPVNGVSGIERYMTWQNSVVRWTGHTTRSKFSRGHVAFFEVESHFVRIADGKEILLPCTDIYTFRDNRIADWRVYADISAFAR